MLRRRLEDPFKGGLAQALCSLIDSRVTCRAASSADHIVSSLRLRSLSRGAHNGGKLIGVKSLAYALPPYFVSHLRYSFPCSSPDCFCTAGNETA
jgi:hypothetical protein